jgi:hypothetical protein
MFWSGRYEQRRAGLLDGLRCAKEVCRASAAADCAPRERGALIHMRRTADARRRNGRKQERKLTGASETPQVCVGLAPVRSSYLRM